MKSDLAA